MAEQSRLKANKKYAEKAYDQLQIRVPKGERDLFKKFAEEEGLALREYIRRACYEKHAKFTNTIDKD